MQIITELQISGQLKCALVLINYDSGTFTDVKRKISMTFLPGPQGVLMSAD